MGKLRQKEQKNKIDGKSNQNQGCCSEQCPWFSFNSMTNNPRYNLSSLSTGSEREQTLLGLYTRFVELSSQTWLYWTQQPKATGLETLDYGDISFAAGNDFELPKDTTVYIFRFDTYLGSRKGRIIGYKKSPCSVLHIIGYDIDFSAYKHS